VISNASKSHFVALSLHAPNT